VSESFNIICYNILLKLHFYRSSLYKVWYALSRVYTRETCCFKQHVAGNKHHVVGKKTVASLLPVCCWIYKGIHVAEQHIACCWQHVARPRDILPRNMLLWCKRGFRVTCLYVSPSDSWKKSKTVSKEFSNINIVRKSRQLPCTFWLSKKVWKGVWIISDFALNGHNYVAKGRNPVTSLCMRVASLLGCAENAGHEFGGPNRRTWKCMTRKYSTKG